MNIIFIYFIQQLKYNQCVKTSGLILQNCVFFSAENIMTLFVQFTVDLDFDCWR